MRKCVNGVYMDMTAEELKGSEFFEIPEEHTSEVGVLEQLRADVDYIAVMMGVEL